jgi:hypothetical protein
MESSNALDEIKRPYRKCLLAKCNNDVSEGRADRKFCTDGHRNEYNNAVKIKELEEIRMINIALKRNRRILKKLLGNGNEVLVTEKKLIAAGFNFDFSTHFIVSKKKSNKFIFSYNYGYCETGYGKYKIVKSFYGDAVPE